MSLGLLTMISIIFINTNWNVSLEMNKLDVVRFINLSYSICIWQNNNSCDNKRYEKNISQITKQLSFIFLCY
jgi:hypothetical protein